jgi:hypothetical protein
VLDATGLDTAGPNAELDTSEIRFGGTDDGARVEIDDLYILDGAGSVNNDFLGDQAVRRLKANGNGTTNTFTGSDADSTDNYLLVLDDNPDDAGSYSGSDGTIGHKDLYAIENLTSTPALIACLTVVSRCRESENPGPVHVVRSNGSEITDPSISPGANWGHVYSIFETDPNTATAWLKNGGSSGVDNAEIGIEIVS